MHLEKVWNVCLFVCPTWGAKRHCDGQTLVYLRGHHIGWTIRRSLWDNHTFLSVYALRRWIEYFPPFSWKYTQRYKIDIEWAIAIKTMKQKLAVVFVKNPGFSSPYASYFSIKGNAHGVFLQTCFTSHMSVSLHNVYRCL